MQKCSTLARMSEADLVQRNGFGAALCCSMKPVMASLSWVDVLVDPRGYA